MEKNHGKGSKKYHFAQITKQKVRYFPKGKQKLNWLANSEFPP